MKTKVFLDTPCFIYAIEKNNKYLGKVKDLLDQVSVGKIEAVSSIITLSELLVQPFKNDDKILINVYFELVTQMPNFTLVSPRVETAIETAKIRAKLNITLPEAFQLALAKEYSCSQFITNDKGLKRYKEVEVVVLDDLLTK